MSTRTCPSCGAEYLLWVSRCAACGVALDNPLAGAATGIGASVLDLPDDDQLIYELIEWPLAKRAAFQDMLDAAGVAYAWEEADLVVHADDEATVDALVESIDAMDPASFRDDVTDGRIVHRDERDELVYDINDWEPDEKDRLGMALDEAGIDWTWADDGSLVVPAAMEDLVESVLDRVEFPDALPADEDEAFGVDAQDVLSTLFVAADRLQQNPAHSEGVMDLYDTFPIANGMAVPYGLEPRTWQTVLDEARIVMESVQTGDDDAIVEAARRLRGTLRPLV